MSSHAGEVNGHIIGIVMKEVVRRAMAFIQSKQGDFEVTAKDGYDGGKLNDAFTTADTGAQQICLKSLRECFPDYGILAEEEDLRIAPANGCDAYFTIDPLDGTKAFIRRSVHGTSVMIALIKNGKIIAAFVGDINTNVVYGYRPDSKKVHRINQLNMAERLVYRPTPQDGKYYMLLRSPLDKYSKESQRLFTGGAFHEYQIDGGSIGTWASRLWRGEVRALVIPPGFETPWDSSPVMGISQKLGCVFMRPREKGFGWEEFTPPVVTEKCRREHDMLIMFREDAEKLLKNLL